MQGITPFHFDLALYLFERIVDLLPSVLLIVLIHKIGKLTRVLRKGR